MMSAFAWEQVYLFRPHLRPKGVSATERYLVPATESKDTQSVKPCDADSTLPLAESDSDTGSDKSASTPETPQVLRIDPSPLPT